MKRIYGTFVERVTKNSQQRCGGRNEGLQDRTLEIYKLKSGYKGVLFKSEEIGWRKDCNILDTQILTNKEYNRVITPEDVKVYFGFT